jgi:hypothetical protein
MLDKANKTLQMDNLPEDQESIGSKKQILWISAQKLRGKILISISKTPTCVSHMTSLPEDQKLRGKILRLISKTSAFSSHMDSLPEDQELIGKQFLWLSTQTRAGAMQRSISKTPARASHKSKTAAPSVSSRVNPW